MLSKVIAHAPDRAGALRKLDRALGDTAVLGVVTNIEFARFLLADPDVIAGNLDTGLLDRRVEDFVAADASDEVLIAAAAYRWLSRWTTSESVDPWDVPSGWRVGTPRSDQHQALRRHPNGARCDRRRSRGCKGRGRRFTASRIQRDPDGIRTGGGDRRTSTARLSSPRPMVVCGWQAAEPGTCARLPKSAFAVRTSTPVTPKSPAPCPVPSIAVDVENGAAVSAGQPLVVVEAMKMEHSLTSPIDGIVEVLVRQGDQVMVDQVLARVVPVTDEETAEVKTENTTQKEDA